MSIGSRIRSLIGRVVARAQGEEGVDTSRRRLLLGTGAALGASAVALAGSVASRGIDRLRDVTPKEPPTPVPVKPRSQADVYQQAVESGLVKSGQFNGLGVVEIRPGEIAFLRDTINRNMWMTRLILDGCGADLSSVVVSAVTIAGLPMNIGSQDAPASAFRWDGTPPPITFRDEDKLPDDVVSGGVDWSGWCEARGVTMDEVFASLSASSRMLVLVGQSVVVTLRNIGTEPVTVTGGLLADELNPYAMQRWMEATLLMMSANDVPGRSNFDRAVRMSTIASDDTRVEVLLDLDTIGDA